MKTSKSFIIITWLDLSLTKFDQKTKMQPKNDKSSNKTSIQTNFINPKNEKHKPSMPIIIKPNLAQQQSFPYSLKNTNLLKNFFYFFFPIFDDIIIYFDLKKKKNNP